MESERTTTRISGLLILTWYVIRYQGQLYIEDLTGGDEKILIALGFQGYATEAEARGTERT